MASLSLSGLLLPSGVVAAVAVATLLFVMVRTSSCMRGEGCMMSMLPVGKTAAPASPVAPVAAESRGARRVGPCARLLAAVFMALSEAVGVAG